jgi:hypothetical protein
VCITSVLKVPHENFISIFQCKIILEWILGSRVGRCRLDVSGSG